MTSMLAIVITMEHTDILQIITWAMPIAAILVVACAWYVDRVDTRAMVHQLELQRLALLEETEQRKKDRAMQAWKNAVSIDME